MANKIHLQNKTGAKDGKALNKKAEPGAGLMLPDNPASFSTFSWYDTSGAFCPKKRTLSTVRATLEQGKSYFKSHYWTFVGLKMAWMTTVTGEHWGCYNNITKCSRRWNPCSMRTGSGLVSCMGPSFRSPMKVKHIISIHQRWPKSFTSHAGEKN